MSLPNHPPYPTVQVTMKRSLAVLAALFLLAAAKNKSSCDGRNTFILRMDAINVANGINDADMRSLFNRYGKRFAYFTREGHKYVIRDAEMLDRLDAIYQPQAVLGSKQAALGTRQAALGTKQASIGLEQARIGLELARVGNPDSARHRELSRRQDALSEQQDKLGEEQSRLGAQQSDLGRKQDQLGRESDRRLQPLLDEAIRNGIAIEVR